MHFKIAFKGELLNNGGYKQFVLNCDGKFPIKMLILPDVGVANQLVLYAVCQQLGGVLVH